MENECTSHICGSFPIFLPKIIKIGVNLTKFWQKQICLVFSGTRCRVQLRFNSRIARSFLAGSQHCAYVILIDAQRDTDTASSYVCLSACLNTLDFNFQTSNVTMEPVDSSFVTLKIWEGGGLFQRWRLMQVDRGLRKWPIFDQCLAWPIFGKQIDHGNFWSTFKKSPIKVGMIRVAWPVISVACCNGETK